MLFGLYVLCYAAMCWTELSLFFSAVLCALVCVFAWVYVSAIFNFKLRTAYSNVSMQNTCGIRCTCKYVYVYLFLCVWWYRKTETTENSITLFQLFCKCVWSCAGAGGGGVAGAIADDASASWFAFTCLCAYARIANIFMWHLKTEFHSNERRNTSVQMMQITETKIY